MSWIPGIKQISQVGNDMYAQGAVPFGIGTTEVGYIANPADTRLLAGRDPVIDEVSVGMSGVDTDIMNASGAAPLQITDAMLGMLRFLETNILPVQDLHGYANPWPAGGGANKWDEEWEVGAYDNNGDKITNNATIRCKNPIPVTGNTTYYFYLDGNATYRKVFYDSEMACISSGGGYSPNQVFTTPANAAYFAFNLAPEYGTTYNHNIAINLPDSVTTYSPYANICPIQGWTGCNVYVSPTTNQADATVYPCTWQDDAGTVYGGTIDLVSGFMSVIMAGVDLGSLSWGLSSSGRFYNSSLITNFQRALSTQERATGLMCEAYKPSSTLSYSDSMDDFSWLRGGTSQAYDIMMRNTIYGSDTNAFKASLTGIKLIYNLATPQYYEVPGNQILTQEGTNYIWTDCGDQITAAYVAVK